jgi:hypothetical protein
MSRFAIPFQVPSKNSLDQHVFTIKPERQIRWKKERTSKTNSGRNVRLIISIIQKLRKQSTVPTYNLRVYDYRLLKVLELTKMHLSYKRIFFGSLSVLVSPRDRWKLDLQFSHRSNFLFHPPTRDFKLVFETVVPGRTPARSKGNHCLFSVSSGAAVAMGDLALMSKTDWYLGVPLPESLKLFARRVSSTLETNMATRRRRGIRNPWVLPPRLCVQ